jgi:hypothetical protein
MTTMTHSALLRANRNKNLVRFIGCWFFLRRINRIAGAEGETFLPRGFSLANLRFWRKLVRVHFARARSSRLVEFSFWRRVVTYD